MPPPFPFFFFSFFFFLEKVDENHVNYFICPYHLLLVLDQQLLRTHAQEVK